MTLEITPLNFLRGCCSDVDRLQDCDQGSLADAVAKGLHVRDDHVDTGVDNGQQGKVGHSSDNT